MKNEFRYPSRDGVTEIHAIEWKPEGEVKAVLQICHGMVEYIGRYDAFASYLCERGIYVTGHDHLGHGGSVQSKEYYGYFHKENGNEYVVGDIHKLREITQKKYPDVPYFMLGHSMGSFLLRQYLTLYGQGLSGAIIMGTGRKSSLVLDLGRLLCRMLAACKGWNYRSTFIDNLGFGAYNRRFEPAATNKDWLSSDPETCQKYIADPLCNFTFTVNAYYHMFGGMKVLTKKESMKRIPRNLPVFFVAGAEDPVGNFGKDVQRVYEKYRDAGIEDVRIKLYEGDRHEILNERDRQQVYEDLYCWIAEVLKEFYEVTEEEHNE